MARLNLESHDFPLGWSRHPYLRGMFALKFPYGSREFAAAVKYIPGIQFEGSTLSWRIPRELFQVVSKLAAEICKFTPRDPVERPYELDASPGERPYQLEARARVLQEKSAFLAFDTGLGKTRPALESAEGRTLVCLPASIRSSFVDEITRWRPGASVTVIGPKKGKVGGLDLEAIRTSDFTLVSYSMLEKLEELPTDFQTVIFDEVHYLKNWKAKRTKAAIALLKASPPDQLRIALSATPITNTPIDLHQPLDLIYPGRFGHFVAFRDRYFNVSSNGYGPVITGLRMDTREELADRLSKVIIRATKQEWAHLLPPLTTVIHRSAPELRAEEEFRGLSDFFQSKTPLAQSSLHLHEELFLKHMGLAMLDKIERTKELLAEAIERGEKKIAVVSYHRSVNKTLEGYCRKLLGKSKLGDGFLTVKVDGSDSPEERLKLLKEAALSDRAVVFATMESVQEGLNVLSAFNHVILSELYYKPSVVAQLLGRFHRVGQRNAVTVEIPILTGTLDDRILYVLKNKLEMANSLLTGGSSETSLLGAMDQDGKSWREELLEAVL